MLPPDFRVDEVDWASDGAPCRCSTGDFRGGRQISVRFPQSAFAHRGFQRTVHDDEQSPSGRISRTECPLKIAARSAVGIKSARHLLHDSNEAGRSKNYHIAAESPQMIPKDHTPE
jgi:hypothetical protein